MAILKIKQNGEWVEKFIKHDASISDLENYYLKSQTYTKEEVNALISGTISFIVVDTLPTASAETMRDIYLVPSSSSKVQNVKDEFITIENSGSYSWEQIGSTAIDLSQYYTKTETNALLDTKANSSDVYNKTEVNSLLGGKQNTLIAGENITIQDNVISASSGSGGISVFKVTFTADESEEDKLVADKTAKEIYDAYTSGKIVMGECGDLKDLPLTWLNYSNEEYEITFVYNGADVVTHNQLYQEQFDLIGMEASSNIYLMKSAVCNDVSVSSTGTSTNEVSYITVGEDEYKIASGGSGHTYSTTEQLTNDVWIDGKAIYEKTFIYTINYNGQNACYTSAIINDIDLVCSITGFMVEDGRHINNLHMQGDITLSWSFGLYNYNKLTGVLTWNAGNDVKHKSPIAYVTMRYTKTTD